MHETFNEEVSGATPVEETQSESSTVSEQSDFHVKHNEEEVTQYTHGDAPLPPEAFEFSRETMKTLESAEQNEVLGVIAQDVSRETSTEVTVGDIEEGKPETMSVVAEWMDRHPKARKLMTMFTLSTALAGVAPKAAQAGPLDGIVNIMVQGAVTQATTEVNQRVQMEQARRSQEIQEQQARMQTQQNAERVLLQHEQSLKRFDAERVAQRAALVARNVPAEQLNVFDQQTKAQHTQILLQHQQQQENQNLSARQQEEQRQMNRRMQQQQMEANRRQTQMQNEANTTNQVIQQGANTVLQNILMKH